MKIIKTDFVKVLIYIGIALILIGGASFAYFNFSYQGNETNLVKAGCLKISFGETNNINLSNTIPMTDVEGSNLNPYTYTITNTCTIEAYYETSFNVLTSSQEGNDGKIKLSLTGDNYFEPTLLTNLNSITLSNTPNDVRNSYLMDTGYLAVGESKTFNLRTWIDYNVTSFTGSFNYRIIVTAVAGKGPLFTANTSGNQVLSKNNIIEATSLNPNFSSIAPSTESETQVSGLYKVNGLNENYTYYFRGNNINNYVKFGTYQTNVSITYKNSSNEDISVTHNTGDYMIWRIVRINEDGTLRLILDDFVGTSAYNNTTNSALYTGYSYSYNGSYVSSTIKTFVDNWYDTHLKTNYESFIEDSAFCNDSNMTSINNISYFGSYVRNASNKTPNLICNSENIMKVSNNKLTNPIGLLSVDELALAGNVYNTTNTNNYLYKNINGWYTLSPSKYENNEAFNFISSSNSIDLIKIDTILGIRPVINIKSNIVLGGIGSLENPYTIEGIRKENNILTLNLDGGNYEGTSTSKTFKLTNGESITLKVPTKSDYTFAGWTVTGTGSSFNSDTNTFTMGTTDTTITANWILATSS